MAEKKPPKMPVDALAKAAAAGVKLDQRVQLAQKGMKK